MRAFRFAALCLSLVALLPAAAAPLPERDVPAPLRPWIPWVMHGQAERQCPFFYHSQESRRCSWPSRLTLSVGARGGSFTFQVLAFRELWVPLPGDPAHWPQQIRVDGQAVAVIEQGGRPGVRVARGSHSIAGEFAWSELPESLPLPDAIGLVSLSVNRVPVAIPNLDGGGRLWLRQQAAGGAGEERIELRVSRLITDDIPLTVATHVELIASGKAQEVLLPNALLEGFVPHALASALPARFDAGGKLRVQVRPGRWQILATGRHMAPRSALALPKDGGKLAAAEEVWAFQARPELRLVTVQGVPAIDPQQTTLPQDWKRFPAYLVKPGETMKLDQTKRGDPDPAPDTLALERSIWLDFDGGGYTLQDRIGGTITRAWRLEMARPQTLGRVAVDGNDQYITQLDASGMPGIELRRGAAQIVADSRIDTPARRISATGWTQDFNRLSATLHLPPGWRLLRAAGADRAPQAWIERWTLLDFFLVLIVTLAAGKLFGWRWGVVALLGLLLSYHERYAPAWLWLNVLAALALLRVLPEGRVRRTVAGYRWISLLAVAAVLVPFAVDQVRQAIYPVLERPWQMLGERSVPAAAELEGRTAPAAAPPAAPAEERPAQLEESMEADRLLADKPVASRVAPKKEGLLGRGDVAYYSPSARDSLQQIDPNAKVQTGPGLPRWSWNEYALQWSGPVERTQQLHLWLISPSANKLLTLLRLALLGALLATLAGMTLRFDRLRPPGGTAALALALLTAVTVNAGQAHAQATPTPEILEQLRSKLLQPPECLPHCAEIARLAISAAPDGLRLRLEAHADADTAIPLPGSARHWLPERVLVNGAPARGLLRDEAGRLWLQLAPGVYQVTMESALAGRHSVELALPLKPRRVQASVTGWTLDGLGEDGEAGESLLLTRAAGRGGRSSSLAQGDRAGDNLPPLVRVDRTLHLGLLWQVTTRVARAGDSSAPVLVKIPLLEGESVTHSDVRAKDGVALVNLGPQTRELIFESALKERSSLKLIAPADNDQIHAWALNLGPQWHVALSGIPVVHHYDREGRWLPQWRPWPGEAVTLSLGKPAGVPGRTLTLDSSRVSLAPGIRATDAQLALSLRASRGGRHSVQLPEGAILQSVAIDGQAQPIRLEGRTVNLPVNPGKQEVAIAWREPRGMSARFLSSQVDVGATGVNGAIQVKVPENRWLLFAGGPAIGPAILFWAVLIVLVPIAFALARLPVTPLKWHHWLLLGLGLTQATLTTAAIVVGWFIALGARKRFGEAVERNLWFNLIQVVLALWTLAAAVSLFGAVENGLLGYPHMQVAGNGSTAWELRWYQDRTPPALPTAWSISVPLMVYRLLMLAWALWLAYALLRWVRWGWECFSDHGLWRRLDLWKRIARRRAGHAEPSAAQ